MESLLSLLRMHRDHELISLGRARLRRALIFIAPKGFQGSTESRPTFRFMESPLFLTDLLTGHEPELRKPLEINKTIFRFMGSWLVCRNERRPSVR